MGPLSAEVGQGIRTKGQWVGRMQNKRARNIVSIGTLCRSRLYCHEKGILKTINKTHWARARLKFWDEDVKKRKRGSLLLCHMAVSVLFLHPTLHWSTDIHDSSSPHNAYEVKRYSRKETQSLQKIWLRCYMWCFWFG